MVKWIARCARLVLVIFCIVLCGVYSHPDIYRVRPKDGGRVIQPYSCRDPVSKGEGVCMFSWNCQRSNGTHLTYCMDRFYFGSCCRLPPGVYIATPPPESSNEVTETEDTLKTKIYPSTHRTTEVPTSQKWSTESTTQEKKESSSIRFTSKPTRSSTTEFPPGLVTWRPNAGIRSTRVPVKVKPTKLFSTKPLFASSTTEDKTTEQPPSTSTSNIIIEVYTSTSSKIATPQSSSSYGADTSTSKSTTQRPQTSVTSVSRRRTRPTRPHGSSYPKRKTRPTRPYHNRNTTQIKTKPTRPVNRPTTPIPTVDREATTSRPTIGTWSNILDRTTKPFSLRRTTSSSLTRKTTPSSTTKLTTPSTTKRTTPSTTKRTIPSSTTKRTIPSSTTKATTSVVVTGPSTTPTSITSSSTTSRTTVRTTVKKRRPTRPHTVSTTYTHLAPKTTQTTTRRTTPTLPTTTTRRTTPRPVEIIEIITFPPFPGATRKPTERPSSSLSTASETRKTTTLRPTQTTSTTEAPYTSSISSTTATKTTTTELSSTTQKIIPSQDYTKDSTVAQTSTSDVILLTTNQDDELVSSSTLNPDLELTTEQGEDTTEQWFTTTSGTQYENLGRNPIVQHRPVQVLYDEHGNEIVSQEHFEEVSASKLEHTNSPTSPMTRKPPTTTTMKVPSTTDETSTQFDVTSKQFNVASTMPPSESNYILNNTELPVTSMEVDTSTQTVERSKETSTISEHTVSLVRGWGEKTEFLITKESEMTTVTVPEFLNYTHSYSSYTNNTESRESTANSFASDDTEKTSVDTTLSTLEASTTESTIALSVSGFDEISNITLETNPTTSHTQDIDQSTSVYEINVPVLTTTSEMHNAETPEATIHGDHWLDDLYDYYDYYLDPFYDHNPHISESKPNKNTEVPLETVNNHKITFAPIGTFDALVQEKNQLSGNSHSSSETLDTKISYETTSSLNLTTTVVPIDNQTSRPTIPNEIKTHSKVTPGSVLKRPQKPFLPSIPQERPSIKKPSKPPVTVSSTEHSKELTTEKFVSESIELTTYQSIPESIIDGIKTTIVTIDNHRPPVHDSSSSISSQSLFPSPVYQPVTDAGDKSETENFISESTLEPDKFSVFDISNGSTEEIKHNETDTTDVHPIDNLINDVEETVAETSTNIPTIRYPFPTILMQHTTKRPVITDSPNKLQTQFDTDTTNSTFKESTTNSLPGVTVTSQTSFSEEISDSTPEDVTSLHEVTFGATVKKPVEEVASTLSVTDKSTEISQQTESTSVSNRDETSTLQESVTSTTNMPDVTTPTSITTTNIIYTSTDIDLSSADYKEVCGKPIPGPMGRIVDGGNSYFGEWPWVVSLRQWKANSFKHKCGATLLNEFWAITAAHCVENVPLTDILLRMGEYDITHENEPLPFVERRVQIIASHPQFDRRTFEYDLALLRFYEPVVFQRNILPACVPTGNDTYVGRYATVTGWGRLYEDGPLPDVIQEVSLPIITNKQCESMYKQAGFVEDIPDIFICAGYVNGGKDSCEGDSGGPMVFKKYGLGYLVGDIFGGLGFMPPTPNPGVLQGFQISEWINQIIIF
ncbi:Serine proteinase stubble like protein [Argiope bruennichi]|uniref:Serine proteinase stubble like protein n=1 Tax=Argiope bruennichi TaxID=94029 RepID=A0A8T0E403_ARGBR|nr:Serine proteinase stubble like protein [Argiope bruennichi]